MRHERKLVIIGASGHGKVVADIAVRCGYEDIVFLDDAEGVAECAGFPVVGKVADACRYADADFVVAIGNAAIRERIQQQLGGLVVTLAHPDAVISRRAAIGRGCVVVAGAVINPDAVIGDGCIINTAASVDHDCVVGSFAHVSVGAHVAGTVRIGARTWVGAGATVSNNVSICADCMIGAGTVVVRDIKEPGTYIGVPAKRRKRCEGGTPCS